MKKAKPTVTTEKGWHMIRVVRGLDMFHTPIHSLFNIKGEA